MDIGIYTTEKTLKHKIKMSRGEYEIWWTLHNKPKILPKRLFVAVNGWWCGYFKVIGQYYKKPNRLYLGKYTEIVPTMSRTPFQGFTYNVPKIRLSQISQITKPIKSSGNAVRRLTRDKGMKLIRKHGSDGQAPSKGRKA